MISRYAEQFAAPATSASRRLGRVVLWLRPDGWQSRSRRNAWAAMVADSQARQSRAQLAREGVASQATDADRRRLFH